MMGVGDPKTGALATIIVSMLCAAIPMVESSHMVFGVACVFGIVFLFSPTWMALGLLAFDVAMILLAPMMMGTGTLPGFAVTIVQCIAAAAGYGIRRYRLEGNGRRICCACACSPHASCMTR